jgi:hypothetical protein
MIHGLPRPLPECSGCGAPLPRAVWRTRRRCADCATVAERMAAALTRAELDRLTDATTARVNDRIERLASKRAAREVKVAS